METAPLVRELLPIVYEDAALLAVLKPAGIDVGGTKVSSHAPASVLELIRSLRPGGENLTVINRLSRYESGLLLLAKDADVAARLRVQWKSAAVEQEYVAVVTGRMKSGKLVLDSSSPALYAKRQGSGGAKSKRDAGPDRRGRSGRKAVVTHTAGSTVLTRVETGERRTLVRCVTRASTTHALRAQLRSVGLRLVGDPLHDRAVRRSAHAETALHLVRVQLVMDSQRRPMTLRTGPPAFRAALRGEPDGERRLSAALVRRLPCLLDSDTDSFRLLNGDAEDMPGLVAEKFGPVVILQVHDTHPRLIESLPGIARWYKARLGIGAVYVKHFARNRGQSADSVQEALRSPAPLAGRPLEPQIEVVERGLRYAIRPYDGFSVGLFLDQRDNRTRIREMSAGKEVLNLFAYTCGFSVAAAAGGATQTVSVDVAVKHLEWGKVNFGLNGIDLANHLFFRSDAMEFLGRMVRQGRSFDLVILDPPSFAHGRGSKSDFSVMENLPTMIGAALEVLRPEGAMLISTNHRKMTLRGLLDRIRHGASGRAIEILDTPPLPPDFAMDPDHAKSVFVRAGGK